MENRVVRFADSRTAYSFVAELRRLYDLERWADLWVYVTGSEVLVDIPIHDPTSDPLTDLAFRYGGRAPVGGDELADLRAAVATARENRRNARGRRLGRDRATRPPP